MEDIEAGQGRRRGIDQREVEVISLRSGAGPLKDECVRAVIRQRAAEGGPEGGVPGNCCIVRVDEVPRATKCRRVACDAGDLPGMTLKLVGRLGRPWIQRPRHTAGGRRDRRRGQVEHLEVVGSRRGPTAGNRERVSAVVRKRIWPVVAPDEVPAEEDVVAEGAVKNLDDIRVGRDPVEKDLLAGRALERVIVLCANLWNRARDRRVQCERVAYRRRGGHLQAVSVGQVGGGLTGDHKHVSSRRSRDGV